LKLTTLSPFHLQTLFSLLEGRLQVNTEGFTLFPYHIYNILNIDFS